MHIHQPIHPMPKQKPDMLAIVATILFASPLVALLLWAAFVFVFVEMLGRPDLCPQSLC